MKQIFYFLFLMGFIVSAQESKTTVSGSVTSQGNPVPFATIYIRGGTAGTSANANGEYQIKLSPGKTSLIAQFQGYKSQTKIFTVVEDASAVVNFNLEEGNEALDEVVVTGTRTEKRRTDSPVIVNLITSETLEQVVATDLSEGLRFQPGLRVEMNCQTCNYSRTRKSYES